MTTDYTPGPWRVYDNTEDRYYPHRVQPDGAPYFDHVANVRGPDAEADARLIAAAPDLVEALLAIRDAFASGELKYTKKRQSGSDPYHPSNVKMTAALAKALGY